MKNWRKKYTVIMMILALVFANVGAFSSTANVPISFAHGGRTDGSGGHRDNKNKSGLGSYHYHCGGYPAHLHSNGVCPYASSSTTTSDSSKKTTSTTSSKKTSKTTSKYATKTTIKSIQNALNDLGYDCGKADGVMGSKTKKALKQYQKDNDLTVDGKIGKKTCEHLGVTAK